MASAATTSISLLKNRRGSMADQLRVKTKFGGELEQAFSVNPKQMLQKRLSSIDSPIKFTHHSELNTRYANFRTE